MLVKNTEFLDWLAAEHEQAEEVRHLLECDQYDQVAAKLGAILPLDDPAANRILTHTVLVMRTVCQSLHQAQRETDWHHWALQNVKARETELRAGLYAILELADEVVHIHSERALLQPETASGQVILLPAGEQIVGKRAGDAMRHVRRILRRNGHGISASRPAPEPQPDDDVVVYGLGGFQVYVHGTLVEDWSSRKGSAIFKYLVLHRDLPIHKEKLFEVIWAGVDEAGGLDRLHGAIYSLRQTLRSSDGAMHIVLFENDHYRLNPELKIWTDFDEFSRRCQRARQAEQERKPHAAIAEYEAAILLYRGALFVEYPFVEWVELERHKLQSAYLSALDKLGEHYLTVSDHLACQTTCQRMLEIEPTNEAAHVRLMRLYARSGQMQLAQQQYQMCLMALRGQGISPSADTTALYAQIRKGEAVP